MIKKKRRLHFKSILFILLLGYLLFMAGYYIYKLPVKNIYIKGNSILTDQEIIDASKLKSYPSIHKYSSRKIASNIKKLDLVDNAKVKKDLFGKVTIIVTEAKPIFFYRNDNKVYLSNEKSLTEDTFVGIPIVINYVPSKILKDLINSFSELDNNVIKQISEIEYNPDEKEGVILDENRFLFRMNDTNSVYIDTINIAKLNNYQKIVAALPDDIHGYIYLNSNRTNASFKAYAAPEPVEDEGEEQKEENEN